MPMINRGIADVPCNARQLEMKLLAGGECLRLGSHRPVDTAWSDARFIVDPQGRGQLLATRISDRDQHAWIGGL